MAKSHLLKLMMDLQAELSLSLERESLKPTLIELNPSHFSALASLLSEKRKALKIDYSTLELQTGVSVSTLKRLFNDPSQVKFSSVVSVAEALGVKLCFVK